ncbi:MAG: DegV family protein [Clostridia bacterium]|nr:DegV family protein [Clostridia bacterium]
MKIKICSDSTSDLTKELYKKYSFGVLPVMVLFQDKEYHDGIDINSDKLFELCEKSKELPKTAAINPSQYKEFFEEQLKSDGGYDAIIHFSISSKLSSLYQNAKIASENFDKKVFVIDSTTLSSAIGLQMIYAYELAQKGETPENIVQKVLSRQNALQASFVIDTLKFLYKGGRCSRLAMFGANLLKIKPIIALKDGKMDVESKPRGKYDDVVMRYVDYILNKFNTPEKSRCFITYSTLDENLVKKIEEKIKPIFKEILITRAGCTVSTHCGPNTVGILYYNDGK